MEESADSASVPGFGGTQLSHDQHLGLDFQVLVQDFGRFFRQRTKVGESRLRFLVAADFDEPTRRVGHEEHADEEDERREELNANRDTPRSLRLTRATASRNVGEGIECWFAVEQGAGVRGVGRTSRASNVTRSVCDPVTEKDTEGDGELLQGDERASEVGW